ncbi:DUF3631 domain-containing protein [Nonomuraea sp. NN258]|uniref:DUF3631 domain-containing protein n=1 Tax=Nonomuraea antri TaxID=2730852 RepID=UPI00156A098C|nr:DUF3631 domain-containing protein [Nonomuraea antri]NRQ38265.1 DUF3631 domain-containing protein [Nonomuraea antri]
MLATALEAAEETLARFIVWPHEHASTIVTLWIAHTYIPKAVNASPRLIVNSALPGAGKSVVLRLVTEMSKGGRMIAGTTPSALFRSLDKAADDPLTLGIDEVDQLFKSDNSSLVALINTGWEQDGKTQVSVPGGDGGDWDAREFRVFAPLVLCGIDNGTMAGAVASRSIAVTMMPATAEDDARVFPYRRRADKTRVEETAELFRDWRSAMDADWEAGVRSPLLDLIDRLPRDLELLGGHHGRSTQRWEALVALADYAGGDWPSRVRDAYAYVTGVEEAFGTEDPSLELLKAMFYVFAYYDRDRVTSKEVIEAITGPQTDEWPGLDITPWREWGISDRKLAAKLKPYGIGSKQLRVPVYGSQQARNLKGYERGDFVAAWKRYAPDLFSESDTGATSATPEEATGGTYRIANDPFAKDPFA